MARPSSGHPLHDRPAARHPHGRRPPPITRRLLFVPLRRETALLRRLRIPLPQLLRPTVFLRASTVCAVLETPEGGAASGRARWLLNLEEPEPRRMRILSLCSWRGIAYLPRKFPKVLDSLRFRIVEIFRKCTLDDGRGTGGLFRDVQKVVMHPDSAWSDLGQCSVYFIDGDGQLGYWKYGGEDWSHVVARGWGCHDIVVYQGKVCVVDE
ncbi:hypothetical protein NL676_006451 [Syzygium grande]|nr:hypothetical protein NL676_006451 [Syzygium grande]